MADPAESPSTELASSAVPRFICPYCGGPTPDQPRCAHCSGLLDPLSRQATQNAMGPWFIRDEQQPHRPGCSYETILALIARGKVTLDSVLRGPTTAQFWYPAKRIPGISSRLGVCHACQARITTEATCPACHTPFEVEGDRQTLGLMPVRMIPTPGASDAASLTPTTPVPPAAPARVLGSVAVPSATESRLRADLAAARRRSSMLAILLVIVALAALAFAFAAISSRDQSPQPAGTGTQDKTTPGTIDNATDQPSSGPSPSSPSSSSPPPAPAASGNDPQKGAAPSDPKPVPVTAPQATPPKPSPQASDQDLQILRRTRLP